MSDGVNALITQLRQVGLPEPQQEYRFAPPRRWRFDLCWRDKHLAVEVDGGTWINGRHSRPQGMDKDNEKINEAQRLGWRVYRFSTGQVLSGEAIQFLLKAWEE